VARRDEVARRQVSLRTVVESVSWFQICACARVKSLPIHLIGDHQLAPLLRSGVAAQLLMQLFPRIVELKGIRPTGILRLDCHDVGPLAGWHLNAQALDVTTVFDVLAIEELQTRDHDWNGRMVVDIDNVPITAEAHFRPGLDRLVRGRNENGNTITGACACQHAGDHEDGSAEYIWHLEATA
jgi:hypothetical protein